MIKLQRLSKLCVTRPFMDLLTYLKIKVDPHPPTTLLFWGNSAIYYLLSQNNFSDFFENGNEGLKLERIVNFILFTWYTCGTVIRVLNYRKVCTVWLKNNTNKYSKTVIAHNLVAVIATHGGTHHVMSCALK